MLINYSSFVACRPILIGLLVFATLVIPIVQLAFGFQYVNNSSACPIQYDIMLLMALGGVFEVIFFALAFGFIYTVTPLKYKARQKQTVAQKSAAGSNRASAILIGCITGIFGACAIMFFVLIQIRVYGNFGKAQWTNPSGSDYCIFAIYSSAFGLMIATYVAFVLVFIVAIICICGICVPRA